MELLCLILTLAAKHSKIAILTLWNVCHEFRKCLQSHACLDGLDVGHILAQASPINRWPCWRSGGPPRRKANDDYVMATFPTLARRLPQNAIKRLSVSCGCEVFPFNWHILGLPDEVVRARRPRQSPCPPPQTKSTCTTGGWGGCTSSTTPILTRHRRRLRHCLAASTRRRFCGCHIGQCRRREQGQTAAALRGSPAPPAGYIIARPCADVARPTSIFDRGSARVCRACSCSCSCSDHHAKGWRGPKKATCSTGNALPCKFRKEVHFVWFHSHPPHTVARVGADVACPCQRVPVSKKMSKGSRLLVCAQSFTARTHTR